MRLRAQFGQTQRQASRYPPTDGRHWLVRGAYWHVFGDKRWWLPLGKRLQARLVALLDAGVAPQAPQRVAFPDVARADLTPLDDALTSLLEAHVPSYRHLPRCLLSYTGERLTAWVLALDPQAARDTAAQIQSQWETVLKGLGLPLFPGEGAEARWGMAPAAHGQETLRCPVCGYAAPQPWATRGKSCPENETLQALTPVATPHATTIRSLTEFLGIPESKTAKAVFLRTQEPRPRLVFAVVRGDMQVSLPKLSRLLGGVALEPADENDIRRVGSVPGYASPIQVHGAVVVVDDLIPLSPNLVAGANREGYHFMGVNYGRDFQADLVADIVAAQPGDPCPHCGHSLEAVFAWPVTHSRGLVTDVTYLTAEGKTAAVGIAVTDVDLTWAVAALAEHARVESGLAWPPMLTPYDVHLIALRGGEEIAETLYLALQDESLTVLYDDRKASPGVKFADADLIGIPWRVTVGKRSLKQGGVEVKPRQGKAEIWTLEEVAPRLRAWYAKYRENAVRRK